MRKTLAQTLKKSDFELLGGTFMSINRLLARASKLWRYRDTTISVRYIESKPFVVKVRLK
jgi:hypothetical protein